MKNLKNKIFILFVILFTVPSFAHHGVKFINQDSGEYFYTTKGFDYKFEGKLEFNYLKLFLDEVFEEKIKIESFKKFNFLDKEIKFRGNPKFKGIKFDGSEQNLIFYKDYDEYFSVNYTSEDSIKLTFKFNKNTLEKKDYKYFLKRYNLSKKNYNFVKKPLSEYFIYQNVIKDNLIVDYHDAISFNFQSELDRKNFRYINFYLDDQKLTLNDRHLFDSKNLGFMSTFDYRNSKIIYVRDLFDYYKIDKDKKLKLSEIFLWSEENYDEQIFLDTITIIPSVPKINELINLNVHFADENINFYHKYYHKFIEILYIPGNDSKILNVKKKYRKSDFKNYSNKIEDVIDIYQIKRKISEINSSDIYIMDTVNITISDEIYKKIKYEIEKPYVANTYGNLSKIFIVEMLILIMILVLTLYNKFNSEILFFIFCFATLVFNIFSEILINYVVFLLIIFALTKFWKNYRIKL